MIANTEQILVRKFRGLPEEKQAQVLEFVEDLEKENSNGAKFNNEEKMALEEKRQARMSLVGIGRSKNSAVSERVDEILAEGINKREGWSLP